MLRSPITPPQRQYRPSDSFWVVKPYAGRSYPYVVIGISITGRNRLFNSLKRFRCRFLSVGLAQS
jgi:hypothetical protein